MVRNSTTLPWTLVVLVLRLTHLRGWNPRLPMRSPSRPRAALHTCGVHTQTHTWQQSPCSDSQERSALRCNTGWCVDTPPLCTSDQKMNRHETGAFTQTLQPVQSAGWESLLHATPHTNLSLEACFFLMLTSGS